MVLLEVPDNLGKLVSLDHLDSLVCLDQKETWELLDQKEVLAFKDQGVNLENLVNLESLEKWAHQEKMV
jgi:hypothetical protein